MEAEAEVEAEVVVVAPTVESKVTIDEILNMVGRVGRLESLL
jgi:hypothetical protein